MTGIRAEKRDIVRRLAAFGPALAMAVVLGSLSTGCSREAAPTIVVPMIAASDDSLDGGDGGGGPALDAAVVELEPSPPADALACRRDVVCRASLEEPTTAAHLPSPFDRCSPRDDQGRAFSARETRDARLTDPARCCYVSFVECVRGAR